MTRFRYVIVDVFTDVPLQGNQLAVFTDAREIPEELLQPLAKEIGFSETVFCYPAGWPTPRESTQGGKPAHGDARKTDETVFVYPPESGGHVKLRIFTPWTELPFAGHPILGTAFVLAGPLQLVEIRLETRAGIVPVRLEREGARIVFGWMTQPAVSFEQFPERDALLAVLGAEPTDLPIELYRQGPGHVMVELRSPEAVAALRPNMTALAELLSEGVDCFARDGERWRSRVFVPGAGVDEDSATGSAAGPLALHLSRHGSIAFGDEIEISQGAEIGRPSTLYAVARSAEHVEVGGSAVIVARGEFRI